MPIARSLEEGREQVAALVERFGRNLAHYRRPEYKEAQVRIEFINPFLEALGWDVGNVSGFGEQYKDVIHEDALKVGGKAEAPDYCVRIGPTRKFFVEAKKPAVSIRTDVGPAYQLRRYAWSAKLPLSILTDFEEFSVYDCLRRPGPGDSAAVGRVTTFTFDQYAERFAEIHAIFAKESVLRGSFDRYAEDSRAKRGTGEVDAEFLKEIEGWRESLARNLALRNSGLSVHELNFAVQHTIDRILFLRIAEDRGIEIYGRLLALAGGRDIYSRLVGDLFRQADEKYNSGLFDFRRDRLSPTLAIDDRVLKPILTGLYYPASPYEFSVLPVEVLGQVYEQFLGKVIRLTPGHAAKVEEKPEVRKAGGVYYTPAYIVDYIVRQTVGRLVEGKGPRELRGQVGAHGRAPLRVLDPACGSGSFLLGAYQFLLNHCLQWYVEHEPAEHARGREPALYQGVQGDWRLTTAEKKRILLDHIYGVDIDRQAVEVTKLSLLLKVLEGESEETVRSQLAFWQERALPDLGNNIKCGNSLIGPDYFADRLLPDEEEMRRVNPFDWAREFPGVFPHPHPLSHGERGAGPHPSSPAAGGAGEEGEPNGGFDVVIGNPPYIRIQTMKEWAPTEVEYYKRQYASAGKGNYDIYVVFVERALELLNARGRMGYILPHKFFQARYGEALRAKIAGGRHLAEIVHFGDQQVFSGATTYTCLLFLDKAGRDCFRFVEAHDLEAWRATGAGVDGEMSAGRASAGEWNLAVRPGAKLFERLKQMPAKLGSVANRIFQGVITGADEVFLFKEFQSGDGATLLVHSKALGADVMLEQAALRPVVRSGSIGRYRANAVAWVLYPYHVAGGTARLCTSAELQASYPLSWSYLKQCRRLLESREQGKFRDNQWYRFGRSQNLGMWEQPKIMLPYMITRLASYCDRGDGYYFVNVTTGGYGLTLHASDITLTYVCGLLNSSVLDFYLKRVSSHFRGGYLPANKQFIEQLPIRTIDFSDAADVARHDRMVALVEQMLDLHKKLAAAGIPEDRALYERQIEAADGQIDALVYELYGLTEEEIAIVEGAAGRHHTPRAGRVAGGVGADEAVPAAVAATSSSGGYGDPPHNHRGAAHR